MILLIFSDQLSIISIALSTFPSVDNSTVNILSSSSKPKLFICYNWSLYNTFRSSSPFTSTFELGFDLEAGTDFGNFSFTKSKFFLLTKPLNSGILVKFKPPTIKGYTSLLFLILLSPTIITI